MSPSSPREGAIPSDEEVMSVYHGCLQHQQGHFLNPPALIDSFSRHGVPLLAQGPSHWHIPPPPPCNADTAEKLTAMVGGERKDGEKGGGRGEEEEGGGIWKDNSRMWASMYHFFCTGVTAWAPAEWDMSSWASRLRHVRPAFEAVNVDLLFKFSPPTAPGRTSTPPPAHAHIHTHTTTPSSPTTYTTTPSPISPSSTTRGTSVTIPPPPPLPKGVLERQQLMFVDTRRVEVSREGDWRVLASLVPGPGQLLLESVSSVVSTGTELKVFRGNFDEDAQLDTCFENMQDATMAFPLAYGYSLVGIYMYVCVGHIYICVCICICVCVNVCLYVCIYV